MGRTTFDYKHTCPQIDKFIDQFQAELSNHLDDLIIQICPILQGTSQLREIREDFETAIYNSAEPCFEGVRETNQEMRKEAEYQIEDLIDEVEEHKKSSEYFERELDDAKDTIEDLKEQIEDLQSEMV